MIGTTIPAEKERFDLVCVGTGFATAFFLIGYLRNAPASSRVLVLERGRRNPHAWQIAHRANSDVDWKDTFVRRGDPAKDWRFNIGFGGGSSCWFGNVPRMMPSDFRLHSQHGVGIDWPVSYEDLEPYYLDAERLLHVSGPSEDSPMPRSGDYPQPPHRFSDPDVLLKRAWPDHHFAVPTARARVATANRSACCANGVCSLCPVDAKLTIENELLAPNEDPRVNVLLEADVMSVETRGGLAEGVRYRHGGCERTVDAELVALGANALFNPHIMLRSGIEHPRLGRRLHEIASIRAEIFLDGVDNFGGSTVVTGHNYALYDSPRRSEHAAVLIETWNVGTLRAEYGKWRGVLPVVILAEDLPQDRNRVEVSPEDADRPIAVFEARSEYALRGLEAAKRLLPEVMASLPVERIEYRDELTLAGSQIQGTVMMGNDPATSIVDSHLVHHGLRNLLVLGSSAFPTGPGANPTLTLCALSLRAADYLLANPRMA